MRFASLGSGSKGNATIIEAADTCLLLDCGFTVKETEARLQRLGKTGHDLNAILVTHEHSDHIKGVGALARKYQLPVYLTAGTFQQGRLGKVSQLQTINCHQRFVVGDIQVQPVPVPHDAREPCQYVFLHEDKKLGVLTDLGSLTPHVEKHYSGLDALVLECNYDPQMLEEGPYPYQLKTRIFSDYGHLSNGQAAQLLSRIEKHRLQHLLLSHISQKNNCPTLASQAIGTLFNEMDERVQQGFEVACQEQGFDWRMIV